MTARIIVGDCRERLAELPDGSVSMCCTSPPYFGLRRYSDSPAEIGLEASLSEYIAALVAVFREVRRVLRPDGTCWIVLGDSYASGPANNTDVNWSAKQRSNNGSGARRTRSTLGLGVKTKDLMMVPARVAIALQADGWWLRSDCIWAKTSCMPESVSDRPTSAHEHVFLLSKRPTYFYDAIAVAEPSVDGREYPTWDQRKAFGEPIRRGDPGGSGYVNRGAGMGGGATRNLRNVWTLGPDPFPGAHFAVYPRELACRCIKAGTSERGVCPSCLAPWTRVVERSGASNEENERIADYDVPGLEKGTSHDRVRRLDGKNYQHVRKGTDDWSPSCRCDAGDPIPATVLDCFAGAGTTGLVADQLGRDAILIELNPDYAAMAEARIRNDAPLFADVATEAGG